MSAQGTIDRHIDLNNDGVDDMYFSFDCNPQIMLWSENGQGYEAQYINGQEAIEYMRS